MLDWLDHNAMGILAIVGILNWLCTIFSHYRHGWKLNRIVRLLNGKMFNGRGEL